MKTEERFTLRIPTELMNQIRLRAARRGISINLCILEMLDIFSQNERTFEVLVAPPIRTYGGQFDRATNDDDNDIIDPYFGPSSYFSKAYISISLSPSPSPSPDEDDDLSVFEKLRSWLLNDGLEDG